LAGTTIGDVWDARLAIEPPAVRQLAAKATKANLAALDRELEIVRLAASDPHALNAAGVQFHVRLIELSGNKTLTTVIAMLSEIIGRELMKRLTDIGPNTDEIKRANRRALRGYEEITEIIHRRDAELADATWRKHLQSARRYLTKSLHDEQVIDLLY
jgi:DNA-binding FadR family transcriptional regulator